MIYLYAEFSVWKPLTNVHLEDTERDVEVTLRLNIQNGGNAVAQLVEALRYQSEGRRFESRWDFLLI